MLKYIKKFRQICQNINNYNASLHQCIFEIHKVAINQFLISSNESGISHNSICPYPVIISLTTYGKRIHDVYLTISSIMMQSQKPNRIILWLDKNEFNENNIPDTLKILAQKGLEIRYYHNIKSYKKIIPTLLLAPNSVIITIDDDVIYPIDFIERLTQNFLNDSSYVYYYRGHRILQNTNGDIMPYNQWEYCSSNTNGGYDFIPTGVGGVLYPPHCFHKDVTNENLFMELAPTADDLWLKVMCIMNGYPSKKVYTRNEYSEEYITIPNSQKIALNHENILTNNDIQLNRIINHYNCKNLFFK